METKDPAQAASGGQKLRAGGSPVIDGGFCITHWPELGLRFLADRRRPMRCVRLQPCGDHMDPVSRILRQRHHSPNSVPLETSAARRLVHGDHTIRALHMRFIACHHEEVREYFMCQTQTLALNRDEISAPRGKQFPFSQLQYVVHARLEECKLTRNLGRNQKGRACPRLSPRVRHVLLQLHDVTGLSPFEHDSKTVSVRRCFQLPADGKHFIKSLRQEFVPMGFQTVANWPFGNAVL